jgi:DNA-binding transcriptional MerR regulator
MARPSKIDRLPPEIRDLISGLRDRGFTLDEIMEHLHHLDGVSPGDLPSRSGLGRHIQGLDKLSERLHRSRTVAEALVRKPGDAPEGRQTRLNIELMHAVVTDLFLAAEGGEDGQVTMDAKTIHDLAKALDHLTRAEDRDAQHIQRLEVRAERRAREKVLAEQAAALDKLGAHAGVTDDTKRAIREALGIG